MPQDKTFTVPSILGSVAFSKDGGLRLGFSTNELTSEEKVAISAFHGQFGWLAFKPNTIDLADMPTEEAEDKAKTPSKRLRAVLYVLAKQRGVKPEQFEDFYREHMEKLIEWVKQKLD